MCSDPERTWYAHRSVCFATLALQFARRGYAALHEDQPFHDGAMRSWGEKRSDQHPVHFEDGVRVYVSESNDDAEDEFLTDPYAQPAALRAPAEEAVTKSDDAKEVE